MIINAVLAAVIGAALTEAAHTTIWLVRQRRKDKIARQMREAEEAKARAIEAHIARKHLFWSNLKEISL